MNKHQLFLVFLLLALSFVLVACSESTVESVPEEVEENAEQTEEDVEQVAEEATEEEPAPTQAGLGQTLKFDDLQITVNSARKTMGDEYSSPDNAFYLVFDVLIENTGAETANISSMINFVVYDADSYAQDQSIMVDTKGSLDGEIPAGRKMAGEIAYDVSESEYYEFIFEDPFTSGQAMWHIESSEITE